MGGIGSGRSYRWKTRATTEEFNKIDIRYMRKAGLLGPNYTGTLSWSCRGEPSGSINYLCYQGRLELSYSYREGTDEWQQITQLIPLDRTPCNYGGERLWFLCPNCKKRVAILYSASKLFLCRHCYQIPYSSQNGGFLDKLINQQCKLGKRIFEYYEYGEGYGKKKGLHWKTFNRLHEKYQRLNRVLEDVV